MSVTPPPGASRPDPSASDLERDLAHTRGRLAGSFEQLAAKLDVKAQASEKIEATRAQASEKVEQTMQQVVQTSKSLIDRFRAASRPVQISVVGAPVAMLILLIVRRARG